MRNQLGLWRHASPFRLQSRRNRWPCPKKRATIAFKLRCLGWGTAKFERGSFTDLKLSAAGDCTTEVQFPNGINYSQIRYRGCDSAGEKFPNSVGAAQCSEACAGNRHKRMPQTELTARASPAVGAPWVVTDDRGIVARGTLEQLGRAEGCLKGWEYFRKD